MMNYYTRYYRSLQRGDRANPRGLATYQMQNSVFVHYPTRVVRRPKDNPAIGFAEGLQFLAGVFNRDAIQAAAPNARLELFTDQSAYGPRTVGQLERVVNELTLDSYSRRAIMMVAHPSDLPEEIPCTTSIQFQITPPQGRSNIRVVTSTINMRSSDAIWGLPYDLIQFGMVSVAVANCLRLWPGMMTLNLANAHVYDSTAPQKPVFDDNWIFDMPVYRTVEAYRSWAREIVAACPDRKQLEDMFLLRRVDPQS